MSAADTKPSPMHARDVTAERLAEVTAASNWLGNNPACWVVKRRDAPLTATEERVRRAIPPDGLDLGFVSHALVYSSAVRHAFPGKPERRALYGLLARGVLRVDREFNPNREVIR